VWSASCSVMPVIMFHFLRRFNASMRGSPLQVGGIGSRQAAEYRALHQTRSAG
jgi:hypothetical protein